MNSESSLTRLQSINTIRSICKRLLWKKKAGNKLWTLPKRKVRAGWNLKAVSSFSCWVVFVPSLQRGNSDISPQSQNYSHSFFAVSSKHWIFCTFKAEKITTCCCVWFRSNVSLFKFSQAGKLRNSWLQEQPRSWPNTWPVPLVYYFLLSCFWNYSFFYMRKKNTF